MVGLMKNPVIEVSALVFKLEQQKQEVSKEIKKVLTPEQIKKKSVEVLAADKNQSVVIMNDIMTSMKKEAYLTGQLHLIEDMLENLKV